MKNALIFFIVFISFAVPAQASKARQKALQADRVHLPLHRIGPLENDPKKKAQISEEQKKAQKFQESQESKNTDRSNTER